MPRYKQPEIIRKLAQPAVAGPYKTYSLFIGNVVGERFHAKITGFDENGEPLTIDVENPADALNTLAQEQKVEPLFAIPDPNMGRFNYILFCKKL